jgi:glycosyltransferase involved in cell wall biosynthesis
MANGYPTKAGEEPIANPMLLSIVMAAHNEQRAIATSIQRILALELPCPFELIVVDDGSTDSTGHILQRLADPRLVVRSHERNQGKGAAILTALQISRGTHVLIFDADSEYWAGDIPHLLDPVLVGRASIVYGTRRLGHNTVYGSLRYAIANRVLTMAANVVFDACIADLHTCLKLFPRSVIDSFRLTEKGFGLDTEITAEMLRHGLRPFDVPVSYVARSRDEGKKIDWRDGIACFRILLAVKFRGRVAGPGSGRPDAENLLPLAGAGGALRAEGLDNNGDQLQIEGIDSNGTAQIDLRVVRGASGYGHSSSSANARSLGAG